MGSKLVQSGNIFVTYSLSPYILECNTTYIIPLNQLHHRILKNECMHYKKKKMVRSNEDNGEYYVTGFYKIIKQAYHSFKI